MTTSPRATPISPEKPPQPVEWISYSGTSRNYSNRFSLGNPMTGSIESGWCLYHMVGACWNQATKAAFPPEPGMKPDYIDGAWRWVHPDQPTAPATPPAGTETATPETDAQTIELRWTQRGYTVSRPSIEEATLVPAALARRLERERDQARRERNEAIAAKDKYWVQLCDTAEALGKISPEAAPYSVEWAKKLRHELAAVTALLEKRTKALEVAFRCSKSATNDLELNTLQEAVRAALAATPESALKEKEGA